MNISLFITPEYVKKYTVVDDNVDSDLIRTYIIQAQELNIHECLGSKLYYKFISDNPNFTGYYLTLMNDYVQRATCQWTLYYLVPFLNFKLTNKAVSTNASEFGTPTTTDDIKYLTDNKIRNTAEFYTDRIRTFIKSYPNEFPEFYTNSLVGELKPNKTNYFCGIYTKGCGYPIAPIPPRDNIDPNELNCC